jgi:hypothetical protein
MTGKLVLGLAIAFVASTTAAPAQTTTGSPSGATSAPSAKTPGANSEAGSRGLSPGAMSPPSPDQPESGVTTKSGRAQPGQARSRPGVAQSADSDGYPECMAMWNPDTTRASREDWSKTCERTRFPLR